jgi:AraC-like DNA-binding protein
MPTEETAERWRHDLGVAFGRLEPEAYDRRGAEDSPGHGLGGTMAAARLGRAGVFSVQGTPQVVRRTSRAIAAAPLDPLKICIQLSGSAVIHQGGRELLIGPGQLAVYDTGRPYDLRLAGRWSCAVVTVPREALHVKDAVLDAAMSHAFSVTSGPGALLSNLTDLALHTVDDSSDSGAWAHLGEASIELVASLLESTPHDSGSDALVSRETVLTYVRAHLHDPDLCHAGVAAEHHMSPRSLHRLFESEEQSVSEAIRSMRLDGARRELTDPRWRRSSVMVVASRWGFREQGHFTRAFKAQFGATPAAMRRTALGLGASVPVGSRRESNLRP